VIGNISIIGFIVVMIASVGCMIIGLWMLFSRKYKHDPRNPIGANIAMLLMPLGIGLLTFNEMGLFPARYYRILIVIGIGLSGGGADLDVHDFHALGQQLRTRNPTRGKIIPADGDDMGQQQAAFYL